MGMRQMPNKRLSPGMGKAIIWPRDLQLQATVCMLHRNLTPSPTEFTMLLKTANARLILQHNEMARLDSVCNTRVECISGVAWITIDGDPRDVVLSRGESFLVESSAPVIVHAIQGATDVRLHEGAGATPCAKPAASRASWWRGWFVSPAGAAAMA